MAYRRNTPRYQRAVQQLETLRPEVRAVLNVRALDPVLESEARNRLAFAKFAADKAFRERQLASLLRYREDAQDLAEKAWKWKKKQDWWSLGIAGAGVPISAASGYLGMKYRNMLAEELKRRT